MTRVFHGLIEVAELAALQAQTVDVRIFDCRHSLQQTDLGAQLYAEGHLPGAQFLHLDRDLAGPLTGSNGRHPLPERKQFAQKMADCGLLPDTQVVAYDQSGGMFAARLWWLLRWLGHEKVCVLNGGLLAWLHSGQPLETQTPHVEASSAIPWQALAHAQDQQPTVDAAYVQAHLQDAQMRLFDARSADRFRGENETLDPLGGHIPGALNRCFAENLDRQGLFFKAPQVLRAEYLALLGEAPVATVVQQCGSGVTACHNLLAMEVAGLSGARLYPGSWSEWCADPSRPRALGAA